MPASTESRRTPWFLLILSLIAVPLVVAAVTPGAAPPSKIALTGSVPDQATKDAAGAKLQSALPPGVTVDNQLAVSGGAVDAAALQKQINDLLAASPITFAPDSADFTPQGADTVKKAAELLKGNSGIKVAISGHVS